MREIKISLLDKNSEEKEEKSKEKPDYTKQIVEFKKLLKEKGVTASSKFDQELPRLIYDQRYLNLAADLRRDVFDEYVKSFTLVEIKSDKSIDRKKGQEMMKYLLKRAIENGDLNLNTSFYEFQEKYGENNSFLQTLPVDREFLFNEAKLKLKKLLEESKNADNDL